MVSQEKQLKRQNELKPFRFLTWLDHFVLPRNSKSQFDQNNKEEQAQPVGELDYYTSVIYSNEWSDTLDSEDEQTTKWNLDGDRSPSVVSTYETFPENVKVSVCKTQKSSQKRRLAVIRWKRPRESITSKKH